MQLIKLAETEADLRRCYPVLVQLRPHLSEDEFVARARRQSVGCGYAIAYVEEHSEVRAVAGYRISECMHAGLFLYVDDLVTDEKHRSKNHGDALFDWLVEQARQAGCVEFSLDSGVQRHDAHRFYFRKKMRISGHHFSMSVS